MPMLWGDEQNTELLEYYKALIRIRKNEPALRYGTRENIFTTEDALAYRRTDGTSSIVCVMNLLEKTVDLEMELTESAPLLTTGSDCRIQVEGGKTRIILPAHGGMILK